MENIIEYHCKGCGKLLFKGNVQHGRVEILCRCSTKKKTLNIFDSERPERQ